MRNLQQHLTTMTTCLLLCGHAFVAAAEDGKHLFILSGQSSMKSRREYTQVDAIELYDHQTDPQENHNVANKPANPSLVTKLTAEWKAGCQAAKPPAAPGSTNGPAMSQRS